MFLNDSSIIMPRGRQFNPRLRPVLVFCGDSVLTEYFNRAISNALVTNVCTFVEQHREALAATYEEVNVYLVTNEGYFAPLYRPWSEVLEYVHGTRNHPTIFI